MIELIYFGPKTAYPERYFTDLLANHGEAVYRSPNDMFQVWHAQGTRVSYHGYDPRDNPLQPTIVFPTIFIWVQGSQGDVQQMKSTIIASALEKIS